MKKLILSLAFLVSFSAQASQPITRDMIEGSTLFDEASAEIAFLVGDLLPRLGEPVGYLKGTIISFEDRFGLRLGRGQAFVHQGAGKFESKKFNYSSPYYSNEHGWNGGRFVALVYGVDTLQDVYKKYVFASAFYFDRLGAMVSILKNGPQTLVLVELGIGENIDGYNLGWVKIAKKGILPF